MGNELRIYVEKKIALIFSNCEDIEIQLQELEDEMWKEKCIREYYNENKELFCSTLIDDITEISKQFMVS